MEVTSVDFWAQYGPIYAALEAVTLFAMSAGLLLATAITVYHASGRRRYPGEGYANAGSKGATGS
jgi:hypothetical protein